MKLTCLLLFLIICCVSDARSHYFEDCPEHKEFDYKLSTSDCDYYFSAEGMSAVIKKHTRDSALVTYRYNVRFENAKARDIVPLMRQPFKKRYLNGGQNYEVNAYRELWLFNAWEGIDIHFYTNHQGELKYDFAVSPNVGDYHDIILHYDGLNNGEVLGKALVFKQEIGEVRHEFPKVYTSGQRDSRNENLDFELVFENNHLSFQLEDYPTDRHLVIDPWCTYFGGNDIDEAYGIAVDSVGNSVITGYTYSADLPVTVGAIDTSYDLDYDAYVAKLDSSGDLLWATYYGGNGGDYGRKVKLDGRGNVYATGNTTSTDLMTSPGAYQTSNAGSYDAYLLKLSPNGEFIWSTLFGGTGGDFGMVEDVRNDQVVIAGFSSSMDLPANGFQTSLAGALDCYMAVFDTSGAYQWSTYFGGTNSEDIHAITFDNQGNIVAVGDSYSQDLPVSTNAWQMNNNGSQEIYILKTSSSGSQIFATYFGGYSNDDANSVCVDGDDRIYISGFSKSTDFPVTTTAVQASLNSAQDGVIARFTPTGQREYASYLGGDDDDTFTGMTYRNGKVYMLMNSRSTDLSLYGTPHQSTNLGFADNYISIMDTSLAFAYSTYFGGVSSESAYEIDVTHDEAIYLSGFSSGTDLAFGSGIFQNGPIGSTDAYVLKLDGISGIFNYISSNHKDDIMIFPNPGQNEINFDLGNWLENEFEIGILSANGELVKTIRQTSPQSRIDIEFLPAGIYILNIKTSKGNLYHKFVKSGS